MAAIALDEHRVERRLVEAGYSVAERAADEMIGFQLDEMNVRILSAIVDPKSMDTWRFAHRIFSAVHPFSVSLAYRTGAVAGGSMGLDTQRFDDYERELWFEMLDRNWRQRLRLYSTVPPTGSPWTGSRASEDLRQASELERGLLADLGFAVTGERRAGGKWSFRRTTRDSVVEQRLARATSSRS